MQLLIVPRPNGMKLENGCWWGKSISRCSQEFDGGSGSDAERLD